MSRCRLAVIGAGNWGWNHIRTLSSMSEVDLVAVCETDAKRRAWVQDRFPGLLVTESLGQALDGVQGAVVAAPAAAHTPVARTALELGIAVLIEKPMTLSVRDAHDLVALAGSAGVPAVVGHLLIFHPAIERLKVMITAGDLGEIYYMYGQRVNLGQVRPDENALWSFGPHDISIAMHLLGQSPAQVSAHGKSYIQPGVEDVVFLTMEFESGIIGHVQMSWLDPHKERRLTVVGSQKMAVFDDMQPREKLKVFDRGVNKPPEYSSYGESLAVREGDVWIPNIPNVEPLRAELEHFVRVVTGREAPRVDVMDGLAVVSVLEAASRSLAEGGRIIRLEAAEAGLA